MVNRNVARKLTEYEIAKYKGPVHHIAHHEVLKSESKSTDVRIVFHNSANYMGYVYNDYWAKGTDLLNNLQGILIRFHENNVAFIRNTSKMYHTIKTVPLVRYNSYYYHYHYRYQHNTFILHLPLPKQLSLPFT